MGLDLALDSRCQLIDRDIEQALPDGEPKWTDLDEVGSRLHRHLDSAILRHVGIETLADDIARTGAEPLKLPRGGAMCETIWKVV